MSSVDVKEATVPLLSSSSISLQNEENLNNSSSVGIKITTRKSGRIEFVYNERDRENFYKDLIAFHENRNTTIARFPRINGKYVDLHKLYAEVIKRGGWLKVNARNEWDELIPIINLKSKCVNIAVALKHIYTRYLDKYEKLNYHGEDPDRSEEQDDDCIGGGGGISSGRHKKWTSKNFHSVPMKYNYNQHNVTEQIRIMNKLSTDLYRGSEYDKLLLSLMSPLPNEQDFAINVCTLMANESKHTLKINHCPKLLDALLGHAGVYCHFTMRELFRELYTNIRKHSLQSFWTDCLYEKQQILELSYEDYFQSSNNKISDGTITRPPLRLAQYHQNDRNLEDGLNASKGDFRCDFLALGRGLGTHDYIGQRINQVTSIIRNLSFFEENLMTLAKNKTFIRFIVMCANIRWGHIHHMALDVCGNIATELELSDPTSDDLTRCLLSTLCDGLEGQDRGVIISCLEILAKLCQKNSNEEHLHKCLNQRIYNQICLFLSLNDIMLLLYTLECVYALSSFGPKSCNALIQVRGIVDTLVSLITVEAQSYGPDGCILMRVVETVPGNMLPMVAQNIANLQNVAMSGQMNVHQMHHHHHLGSQMDSNTSIPEPSKFTGNILNQAAAAAAIPANARIIHHQGGGIPNQMQKEQNNLQSTTPQTLKQENEHFALTWLRGNFELTNVQESRIDQQELYKMYVAAVQKAGRRGQMTAINFPRLVRNVFGTSVGPHLIKTTDQNGIEHNSFHYICLRAKSNPLPAHNKNVIVSSTNSTNVQQQSTIIAAASAATIATKNESCKIVLPQSLLQNNNNDNFQKPAIKSEEMSGKLPLPVVSTTPVKQTKKAQIAVSQQQSTHQITYTSVAQDGQQQQQQAQQKMVQIQAKQHHPVASQIPNQTVITTRLQEPQNQISTINKIVTKNITVAQHQITSQMIATTLNKPTYSHVSGQTQQQQQRSIILQQSQQQHQIKNNLSNTVSAGSSQNGSGSSSSLVKSLLANKVTTTTATDVIDVTNASAAPNNPSLITQNVNLHQVAQRQHLQKQKELANHQKQLQQQQHKQQLLSNNHLTTTTISALVGSPVIPTTAVKVGQTTIKAITSNAVIPSTVLEKKSVVATSVIQINDELTENDSNNKSSWEPIPPLAPITIQARGTSGTTTSTMMNVTTGIGGNIIIQPATAIAGTATVNEDSNSIGNASIASSIINSTQVNTIDDGDTSLISFEGLLIPKSKPRSSSLTTTEEETNSKDSYSKQSQTVFHANQMLVDLLDKKSPDPPININSSIKRKLDDDSMNNGNGRKKLALDKDDEDDELMVAPSKNAANLYAEIAASILEDEDLQDDSPVTETTSQQIPIQIQSLSHLQVQATIPSQTNQRVHTPVIQKPSELTKQVITMPVPVQRQIIMAPNNTPQMLLAPNTPNQTNQTAQATATIKTDAGLQSIPVILQKQIMAGGQQIIQPVIQQSPQNTHSYVLATNAQGQTYLVAQQQPTQTVLLAQTPQQQGTPTKTIIILQQPGGAPQPVAQQQIISSAGGSQKVIMTTQQGQQMIVTQMPRTVHQHQLIVNHSSNNTSRNAVPAASNVIISQPSAVVQQQQAQSQIHIQPQVPTQVQKQKIQIQTPQSQLPPINANVPQTQPSIHLPHIPATIKVHTQMQLPPSTSNKSQISKVQQAIQQPSVSVLPYQSQLIKKPLNQTSTMQHQQPLNNSITVDKKDVIAAVGNGTEVVAPAQNPQPTVNIAVQQNQTAPIATQPASTISATNIQPQTSTPQTNFVAAIESNVSSTVPCTSLDNKLLTQPQNPQPSPGTSSKQKSTNDNKTTTGEGNDEEVVEIDWLWVCDWRNCPRKKFRSLNEVYRHACIVHCPDNLDPSAEIYCQWGSGPNLCDNIPRKRFSLMTHLLDRHCTPESFKAAVQRRITNGIPPSTHCQPVTIIKNLAATSSLSGSSGVGDNRGTDSPTVSTIASAAIHAIKRHTADFVNPKELMDENEGPVTKSIRLTAALILRNLVTHTTTAKKNVRYYEPHLAGVALSNVESSRTISQILYELNN